MIRRAFGRPASPPALAFLLLAAAACGGGDGCPSCPVPVTDGALRMTIEFDDEARRGLEPAGFRVLDLARIDIEVTGGPKGLQRLSIGPAQTGAFLVLEPGSYGVTAKAFGEVDLLLFSGDGQVAIAAGDTVDLALEMEPRLGTVTLTVDGQTSGTVEAVAGEDVPFSVVVRNSENRPVPNATIGLRTAVTGYGQVVFAEKNTTDPTGTITGVIRAPFHGALDLVLEVDGRPIPSPGATRVEFATGVAAGQSMIVNLERSERPDPGLPLADGGDTYTFTVEVRNAAGEPLSDIPVVGVSSRNVGVDSDVDIIEPRPGYETGVTDASGRYAFTVRTYTSSFVRLDEEGRLTSDGSNGDFTPSTIEIFADEVPIDQRTLTFNSAVDPNGIDFNPSRQFVAANGQDSAVLEVEANKLALFGGGPVDKAVVEVVDAAGHPLNAGVSILPEPGFDGFRMNGQGVWRGRIMRTQAGAVFFYVKVDGRTVVPWTPKSVIFQ